MFTLTRSIVSFSARLAQASKRHVFTKTTSTPFYKSPLPYSQFDFRSVQTRTRPTRLNVRSDDQTAEATDYLEQTTCAPIRSNTSSFNRSMCNYNQDIDTTALFIAISELSRFGITLSSFPELVSIGNQSAGKSSVFDALIGGYGLFPKNMGMSTMKPIRLTTIRSDETTFEIGGSKIKSEAQARHEIARLNVNSQVTHIDVRVYSPNVRNLFMVDLPGMFSVPDDSNPDLPSKIEEINMLYLQNRNNIPVLVSDAPTDPANNLALKVIGNRKADAIGVITKTDMAVRQSLEILKDMLNGRKYALGGGWVAVSLRNKVELDSGMTVEEKIKDEEEFFAKMPDLKPCGVETMKRMISNIQFERIKGSIPQLIKDIDQTIMGLEKSKTIFDNLLTDPSKTLPKKLTSLINKLVESSPDRSEFERELKLAFKKNIGGYIEHEYINYVKKSADASLFEVETSLLNYLKTHYTSNMGTYNIKDTSLTNSFQELFGYGPVSPLVVNEKTIKEAFAHECARLCSIAMFEPNIDDPLGKKRLQWYRYLQRYFATLTNDNNVQDMVYEITTKMIVDYINNDPEICDDLTRKFSEYLVTEIGSKAYNENIKFSIRSMINIEKRPNISTETIFGNIIEIHPEYTQFKSGLFGPSKKKVPIDVYGELWNIAYLKAVSDRISGNCYSHVAVDLIGVMIEKLLEMCFDMLDKNNVGSEKNKIDEKINKLVELKKIVSEYKE